MRLKEKPNPVWDRTPAIIKLVAYLLTQHFVVTIGVEIQKQLQTICE
jgi:hypothetical protein